MAWPLVAMAALCAVAAGVSRWREEAAGALLGLVMVAVSWVGQLTPAPDSSVFFELVWHIAAIGIAAIHLPPRWMAGWSAGVLGVSALVLHANPEIPAAMWQSALAIVGLVHWLGLAHAWMRQRNRAALEARERALYQALEGARARAEEAEQARGRMAALQAELVQMGRLAALGELAATVAHEVNNPLTAARLGIDELRDLGASPDAAEVLDAIEDAIRRCTGVVGRLLDSVRRREDQPGPVDLSAVATRTLALVQRHLERKGASVTSTLPSGLLVVGRESELEQVLLNLLLNAGEAVGGGRGQIRLAAGARDGRIWVEVADSGPGVPETLRRRIFEPFFTTRGSDGSTGLGLAVCQRLVQNHGGEIQIEDAPEGGALFRLELPADSELACKSA